MRETYGEIVSLIKNTLSVAYTGMGSPIWGMFEMEVMFLGLAMLILKVAFSAGSSKHGNARRASVGWNWVVAIHL